MTRLLHPTPNSEEASQATRWYLESLAKSRDPLHDDRSKIEAYVSKGLLREIDRLSNSSDGLDEDYVIRAQDYLNDWASNIVVSDVKINGSAASAMVTLGSTKQSRHPLALNLINEGDGWKISRVK